LSGNAGNPCSTFVCHKLRHMQRKILLINGHPDNQSFNSGLAEAYKNGALTSGAQVREIVIADLDFNPNLQYGYRKRTELEPDLLDAWEKIRWADHLVWIHPVWWGGLPAVTKGFIDRVFLPGFAFRYRENSVWWDKLLKGKTARIITTLDQPGFFYRLFFGRPSVNQLRRSTLEFCGVKPVKVTYVGIVKGSTDKKRAQWLAGITKLGLRQG
jgi:NAD(P)H dehydrogenase (quinone)